MGNISRDRADPTQGVGAPPTSRLSFLGWLWNNKTREARMRYATRCALCLSIAAAAGCGGQDKPAPSTTAAAGSSPTAAAPASGVIAMQRRVEGHPLEASTPGRFQIIASSQARGSPFLLDTQTGRVWQLRDFAGLVGSPTAWHEMTIIDDRGQMGITSTQFQKLYPPRRGEVPPSERHRRR